MGISLQGLSYQRAGNDMVASLRGAGLPAISTRLSLMKLAHREATFNEAAVRKSGRTAEIAFCELHNFLHIGYITLKYISKFIYL